MKKYENFITQNSDNILNEKKFFEGIYLEYKIK